MAGRVKLNRQLPQRSDTMKGSIVLGNENPSLQNAELGSRNIHSEFNSKKNIASKGNFGSNNNIDGRLGSMKVGSNANFEDDDDEDVVSEEQQPDYNAPKPEEAASNVQHRTLQRMAPVQAGEAFERTIFKWMIVWLIVQEVFNLACLGVTSAGFADIVNFDEEWYYQLESVTKSALSCGANYKSWSSLSDCTSGTPTLPMGKYLGTKQGCDCPDSDFVSDSCDSSCTVVNSIAEKKLYYWKGIGLCADNSKITYSSDCGNQGLYSFTENFFMCIPDFVSTITDIAIKVDPGAVTVPSGYSSFTVTTDVNNLIYYYATSNTRNVFTGFQITYGEPCLARNLNPPRSNIPSPHPFEVQTFEACGTYGTDPSAVLIDSTTEDDLFIDNTVDYSLIPGLSDYVVGQTVYLYATYAPKIRGSASSFCYLYNSKLCSSLFDGDFDGYRQFTITNQKVNFIISLCLVVFYGVQILILYLKKDLGFEKYFFQRLIVYSTWGFGIFFTSQFAFSLLFYDYGDSKERIENISTGNCFANEKINVAFGDLSDVMSMTNQALVYTIVNFSLRAGLVLFVSIINCTMKDLIHGPQQKLSPRGQISPRGNRH